MDIINEKLVLIDVDLKTKNDVIDKLCDALDSAERLNNKEQYKKDVYLREEEISTAMGLDIAIPHARSLGVKTTSLVFVKLKDSIIWNEDTVKVVIGIAVPALIEEANAEYLKILSKIARKLMDDEFREKLVSVTSSSTCLELLSSIV